ncbi:MAG: HD domain-containing protein, partial [Pseudomonadota bacterium]
MSLLDDLEAEVAARWAGQTDGAHDIWHIRRVWASCQRIAEALEQSVDRQVLMIATYLHDIINLAKDDPRRSEAAQMSADHAVFWMEARDLPGQNAVAHAILG